MWRKIHSDRDPRDTLFSELRREFRPWLDRVLSLFRQFVAGYPRLTFGLMLILMLFSAVLSFTVFRNKEAPHKIALPGQPAVVSDGFGRIMEAAGQLSEAIRLRRTVDSLTAKSQLNTADSLLLDSILDRLQQAPPLKIKPK